MAKLRTPLLHAKLWHPRHLVAKLDNETLWTSVFAMLQRHIALRPHVAKLDFDEPDELPLPAVMERRLDVLLKKLKDLKDVVLKLQGSSYMLLHARAYFESVVDVYLTLFARLNPSARIVHSVSFESGVIKIQERREKDLTNTEKQALQDLQVDLLADKAVADTTDSIVERTMKSLKAKKDSISSAYAGTRYLLPTSNLCEQLFSIAGHALTNRCRGTLPYNFEGQLFLYMNDGDWDIDDVKAIVTSDNGDAPGSN